MYRMVGYAPPALTHSTCSSHSRSSPKAADRPTTRCAISGRLPSDQVCFGLAPDFAAAQSGLLLLRLFQETHMRINTEARPKDFELAVNWISRLIGAALNKRVAGLMARESKNPLLATHFRDTFALEFALAKLRKYRRSTGRLPKNDEYTYLYGFLVPAHRIYAALPPEARTYSRAGYETR